MKVNGESIYGCQASGLPQPQWGRITAKGNKLYLHVFDWPADNKLMIKGLDKKISGAYLLLDRKDKIKNKLLVE